MWYWISSNFCQQVVSWVKILFTFFVVIFRVDNSSLVSADNRKKDIPSFGKGPTDGLDDMTITAEAEYSVNIINQKNKICLSLHTTMIKFFCMLLA